MSTRRCFLMGLGSFAGGILSVRADDLCAAFNKDAQAEITSEQALARLKAGNARFVAGHPVHCNPQSQVKATASGQAPFAAVLGCMDSRTAPELVFDQRIGDIFAVRVAGNFVNTDILGSLEYATQVAGAKLVIVLGHSDCGAQRGGCRLAAHDPQQDTGGPREWEEASSRRRHARREYRCRELAGRPVRLSSSRDAAARGTRIC